MGSERQSSGELTVWPKGRGFESTVSAWMRPRRFGIGSGTGLDQGFVSGHGWLPQARAPSLRAGDIQVSGWLPKEPIQRIVRLGWAQKCALFMHYSNLCKVPGSPGVSE